MSIFYSKKLHFYLESIFAASPVLFGRGYKKYFWGAHLSTDIEGISPERNIAGLPVLYAYLAVRAVFTRPRAHVP
jgi:hypothetical protein